MPLHLPGTIETDAAAALDPIRIATDELELVGWVAPTGQRITDMLLRGQDLAFLPAGAQPEPEAWISIAPADVLFVVPPALPEAHGWRSTTAAVSVAIDIGSHRIEGAVHLPPGASLDARLTAERPFLPLTSASITVLAGGVPPARHDVVIVNVARARELRRT
jgi:hypothetical protein